LRLAKYLAQAGIASRRHAEQLIVAGRVKFNGAVVKEMATQVDPLTDRIEVDGQLVGTEEPVYILLHKPPGYLSTVTDSRGRPTVIELVGIIKQRIYPVGRLDYDTAGLLLLSNDGQFTNLIIHPRYKIDKKYTACINGRIQDNELRMLQEGVRLEEGLTAPAQVKVIKRGDWESLVELTIHEGRKRQVKRMFAAVGHPVLSLTRTGLGFLSLAGVEQGQFRHLHPAEVEALKTLALHGKVPVGE
jgi:23S rRNA pseudouridine2605 synthase